jgi:hypothetical protein
MDDFEKMGTAVVALVALAGGAYKGFLALRKDTSTNTHALAIDNANEVLIKNLQAERDGHKAECDRLQAMIDEIREQNSLIKSQNAMMRMMLINKGVSIEELTAIGAMA